MIWRTMTNCLRKLLFFSLVYLFTTTLLAQQSFRSQLTVISENDNYTFKFKDRYYTNGVGIRYSRLLRDGSELMSKKIFTTEIGHKIYNPYKQDADFASTMDRPFTGFLYLKSGITYITPAENIIRWNVMAGVVGAAALGKEVQSWHHRNFGLPTLYGWETQLKSEFGMNVQGSYYQHLFKSSKIQRVFDAQAKAELIAGTEFTAASTGLILKLGAFERAYNSVQWDARLHSKGKAAYQRKSEFFLYFEPSITYQVYNATVQGGFFTRKQDQYTTSIQPLVYSHSFGLQYAESYWTLQLGITYKTKEAATMKTNEAYGTIGAAYRFN
jgi:lipid A 3-O-deacylase